MFHRLACGTFIALPTFLVSYLALNWFMGTLSTNGISVGAAYGAMAIALLVGAAMAITAHVPESAPKPVDANDKPKGDVMAERALFVIVALFLVALVWSTSDGGGEDPQFCVQGSGCISDRP